MGLDCHDTGIVTVAHVLREAGYEVIYIGLHNSADRLVGAAVEEGVDAIGVSFLSGQHLTQIDKLMTALHEAQLAIPVFCGGVIPPDDAVELREKGVADVIPPGTLTKDLVARVGRIMAG